MSMEKKIKEEKKAEQKQDQSLFIEMMAKTVHTLIQDITVMKARLEVVELKAGVDYQDEETQKLVQLCYDRIADQVFGKPQEQSDSTVKTETEQ